MTPSFACDYAVYSGRGQTIIVGDVNLAFAVGNAPTHFAYLLFGMLCGVVTFASSISAFCDHIINVILARAKKQVGRIDTGWIVALVADIRFVRNRAERNFVTDPTGKGASVRSVFFAASAELTVTLWASTSNPFPTFIGAALIYLLPKSLGDRARVANIFVVTQDELDGFSRFLAAILTRLSGEWSELPTTALAITVRDFLRGMIGVHRKPQLSVSNPGTLTRRCLVFLLGFCSFILAQVGEYGNA